MSDSNANGRITKEDLRAKFAELKDEATGEAKSSGPAGIGALMAGGAALLGVVFAFGRRKGKKRRETVVEVKRV